MKSKKLMLKSDGELSKHADAHGKEGAGMSAYTIRIFVEGNPGYFEYGVGTSEQAMTHFGAITNTGYRRVNDRKEFEWYAPSTIRTIKIIGEGLDTQYPDKFQRT